MVKTETALRRDVIETALEMERLGINQATSGNISARWRDGLLITPSGVPYADLQTQDIVWLPLDVSDDADVFQQSRPSTEWRFHRGILCSRPAINTVVQTHSHIATALALHHPDISP